MFDKWTLLQGVLACWSPSVGITGGSLLDRSQNKIHASLSGYQPGSWKYNTHRGRSFSVLQLGGSPGISVITASRSDILKDTFTASMWITMDSNYQDDFITIGSGNLYNLWYDRGNLRFDSLGKYGSPNIVSSGHSGFAIGSYQNLTVTLNGTNGILYRNGIKIGSGTMAPISGNTNSFTLFDYFFAGRTSEVIIWNKTLDASEVKQYYDIGPTGIGGYLSQNTPRSDIQQTWHTRPITRPLTKIKTYRPPQAKKAQVIRPSRPNLENLTKGVVGCWSPSLGVTGTQLRDVSHYKNHGTLTNMDNATDWVVDGGQYALDFDGSDDHVAIGSNVFSGLSVVTVSLWGKPRTVTDRMEFTQGTDSVNRTGYAFSEDGNAYVVPNFAGAAIGFGYCNWSSFGVTNFLHGVFIYNARGGSNAERAKIYINGTQQTLTFSGTTPTTAISQGGTPLIGARPGPATYSNGEFAEAIVWNRELTANEVRDLYLLGRGAVPKFLKERTQLKSFSTAITPKPNSRSSLIVRPAVTKITKTDLLKGIVGCWSPSLGVTGTQLMDVSPYKNHGTLTNMDPATDWVVSGGQYSLDFDGTNDYVRVAKVPSWRAVSVWILSTTPPPAGGAGLIAESYAASSISKGAFIYLAPTGQAAFDGRIGAYISSGNSTTVVTNGQWMHLFGQWDGTWQIWVNGKLESSSAATTAFESRPDLNIGGGDTSPSDAPANTNWYQGRLDDLTLFSRSLTAKEVRDLYLLGRGAVPKFLKENAQATRKVFASTQLPSTWLKTGNEWQEVDTFNKQTIWKPSQPRLNAYRSPQVQIIRPSRTQTTIPRDSSLLKGVVGCWSPSLGVTGTQLRDVSPYKNHGTLTNMDPATDWVGASVRGVGGTVLDYDGSNDYTVVTAKGFNNRDLPVISMAAWVRLTVTGYGTILTLPGTVSGATDSAVYWYAGNSVVVGQRLYIGSFQFAQQVNSGGTLAANVWSHIGFSYNNRVIRFFQNGVFVSQQTAGTNNLLPNFSGTNGAIASTGAIGSGSERWTGQIGEVAIFERVVSDAEFSEIYRRGNGAIGSALTNNSYNPALFTTQQFTQWR